ncbi:MAG: hypothetical protein JSV04_06660 [Candidatus Heimdallarchaeota archaeon]|nr:MAG: hypothetical protein JSV04_06660 [Candidatus Heimdallarchaeota archaeon]
MEIIGYSEITVRKLIEQRKTFPKRDEVKEIINEDLVRKKLQSISKDETSDVRIREIILGLEKISNYIPIPSEKELEEIIKLMILLSQERARFHFLFDELGLNLMTRVRECMIRYLVVLSELRARNQEFFSHWFTEESWIFEWSSVILGLSPSDNMEKYSFPDLTAHDFLHMLSLELACADSTSKLDRPMIRMQAEEPNTFIIIPTEAAAKEYQIQVSRILNNELTFTQWVNSTLSAYELPKS